LQEKTVLFSSLKNAKLSEESLSFLNIVRFSLKTKFCLSPKSKETSRRRKLHATLFSENLVGSQLHLSRKDGEVLAQVIRLTAPLEQGEQAQVLRELGGAERGVHAQHILGDEGEEVVVGHELGLVAGGGVGAQARQVQVRGIAQVKPFLHLNRVYI